MDHGTSNTYTITPTVAATYRVTASIENSDASQVSDPAEQNLIIKEGVPPDFCDDPANAEDPLCIEGGFPIWIILILAGIVLILVGILVPMPNFPWKLILLVAAAALLVVGVVVFP